MKKTPTIISLQSVTKKYELHHEKPTFVEKFFHRKQIETFTALSDLSLEVNKGERVGIIGENGSGKTTLLKIISGITQPSSGTVAVSEKIVSLIDLEAGMHPDLTGEENIFLNGLIIGMRRAEIQRKFSSIVAFADIGKFIDSSLYTYSWGMKLRLSFSVAIHSDPDILILDEGIAVGDEFFIKKAMKKIQQLIASGKTVIIATHWLEFLRKNCQRIIWLEKGKVYRMGGTELLDQYKNTRKNKF